MDCEKFYQQQMARSERAERRQRKLQPLYEACRNAGSSAKFDESFEALWVAIEHEYRPVVRALTVAPDHLIDDIMQDISISLFQSILREREAGTISPNFDGLVGTVARRRAYDYGRARKRVQKRFVDVIRNDDSENDRKEDPLEGIPDSATPASKAEDRDRLEFVHWMLKAYAEALLAYTKAPQKVLANCYARVLYHLDYLFGPNAALKSAYAKTATSVEWAYIHMDQKRISTLAAESEQTIQWQLYPTLRWCDVFRRNLEEQSDLVTPPCALKDLYYTQLFGKENISDWAESIHESIFNKVARRLAKEPRYLDLAREYLARGSKLSKLLEKGEKER